jgi:hypothetical protein
MRRTVLFTKHEHAITFICQISISVSLLLSAAYIRDRIDYEYIFSDILGTYW